MALVKAPGVGYREGLEDSADPLSELGPEQKVEVIGHEAIAEQAKRIAVLGFGKGFEEGNAVGIVTEDISTVVAAIECVIDETVIDGAR